MLGIIMYVYMSNTHREQKYPLSELLQLYDITDFWGRRKLIFYEKKNH
jgi:hypothetical protein